MTKASEDNGIFIDWETADAVTTWSLKSHLKILEEQNEKYAKKLSEKLDKIDLMDYQYNLRMIENMKAVLEYFGAADEGT